MKNIIVPVDFSPVSLNAAYYGADMALAINADITLLHNVSLPVAISEIPVSGSMVDEMIEAAKNEMENTKSMLVGHTKHKINVSIIVTAGALIDEIKILSEKQTPFAVIMGIHGSGSAPRWLMGSNAFNALHQLAYLTIIIPEHVQFRKPEKIALACDLDDVNATVPTHAIASLIDLFSCSIDILHVGKPQRQQWEILPESVSLQNMLAKFHPQFHFLTNEDIVTGIAKYITEQKIDMLVIIPKKRDFLSSIFHKSISNDIAAHIALPIMTLHA